MGAVKSKKALEKLKTQLTNVSHYDHECFDVLIIHNSRHNPFPSLPMVRQCEVQLNECNNHKEFLMAKREKKTSFRIKIILFTS
jgi:hypothetical protein